MSKDVTEIEVVEEVRVEVEETVVDDWVLDITCTLVRLVEICGAVEVEP